MSNRREQTMLAENQKPMQMQMQEGKNAARDAMSGIARKKERTVLKGKSFVDVVKQKDSRSLLKPHTEKQRTAS